MLFAFAFPQGGHAQQGGSPQAPSAVQEQAGQDAGRDAQALIRVLEDPGARQALIDYLQKGAGAVAGDAAADASATSPQAQAPARADAAGQGAEDTSADAAAQSAASGEAAAPERESAPIALRIAEATQHLVREAQGYAGRILRAFTSLPAALTYSSRANWDLILGVLTQIALIGAVLLVSVHLLRRLADRLFERVIGDGKGITVMRRALLLLLRAVIEVVVVAVAISAGYGIAFASGPASGQVELFESLILNAFFIVQVAKVATRFALSPRFGALRLVPLDDIQARYWRRWLFAIYDLLGYGVMVAVPVISRYISFLLADSVRMIIVLLAVGIAILAVMRNRIATRDRILAYAERQTNVVASGLVDLAARTWHLVAIFYVLLLLGVWLARPVDAGAFMVRATVFSVLSVMIGTMVSLALTRAIKDGLHLPDNIHQRLPLLERRINAFVPRALTLLRFVVFIGVVLGILQAWGAVDVVSWFGSGDGQDWVGRLASALIVVFVGFLIWLAIMSWIDLRMNPRGRAPTSREKTLFGLFRNAFTILLVVMITLLALSELGVNIGPLIAGAGVFGLAISFGSQKLVQDIITGAFIQVENAMNEGDVVTLGGVTGTVEKLTIRSVRLRDLDGAAHMIPFSTVDRVTNFMRGYAYHVAAIGVAYDSDISEVKMAMHVAFDRLKESEAGADILEPLEMHGVTVFGDSAITVRARIKTKPGSQWAIGRAYNEFVKAVFDERGIEIPFPQVTYHSATPPQAVPGNVAVSVSEPDTGEDEGEDTRKLPAPEDAEASRSDETEEVASDPDISDDIKRARAARRKKRPDMPSGDEV
jgi:small conductance mechanosensitive channel